MKCIKIPEEERIIIEGAITEINESLLRLMRSQLLSNKVPEAVLSVFAHVLMTFELHTPGFIGKIGEGVQDILDHHKDNIENLAEVLSANVSSLS